MATITTGYTWAAGSVFTASKMNDSVNNATITLSDNEVTTAKIAAGAVTAPKMAAGAVVQVIEKTGGYSAVNANQYSTGSAPTSAGGNLLISEVITPQGASNKVRVEFQCTVTGNANEVTAVFALFRGTTLINADLFSNGSAGYSKSVCLSILDSPASASEQTYSVRWSGTGGNTVYIGGYGSAHLGGASKATLTLTEIKG